MKKYFIKVIGKTFFNVYTVKAENLFFAKVIALNKFLVDYPFEKGNVGTKIQRVTRASLI